MRFKIAFLSPFPFAPRCVRFRICSSHSIYTTIIGPNHGPVSPGTFDRTSPSPAGYCKLIPYGWSSAHIFLVVRSNAQQRANVGSQYRDFVFRRIFVRNSEHGAEDVLLDVRELCRLDGSYGLVASLFCGLVQCFVGCLSAAPLLQKF